MKIRPARGTCLGILGVSLLLSIGCIAVSREVRQDALTSGANIAVHDRGHWAIEQEWQCEPASRFDLERERAGFDRSMTDRVNEGWELTEFDVVSLPEETGQQRVCLVGTFRRWELWEEEGS